MHTISIDRVMPFVAFLVFGAQFSLAQAPPAPAEGVRQLRSESRSPYVHRLTLYDHDGKAINPADENPPPYSPKATCSKCHETAVISAGWHFNACAPGVDPGRNGEPWLLTDARFGMAVPISGRGWPGTFKPEQVGLSAWQMTLAFGHHSPGGGYGDVPDPELEKTAEAKRWNVSGRLEVDCMFCHAADRSHDPAEYERQIERENLRWIPTAALGLATIRGDAKRVPDDFDPMAPNNSPDQSPPRVAYDRAKFDGDNRVLFNVVRQPSAERCYFCHTTREVGEDAPPRWQTSGDVHVSRGIGCASCHRNGIDHQIARGWQDLTHGRVDLAEQALSCEGCHLGWVGAPSVGSRVELPLAGSYGAPRPAHAGIPPLHFDKLTCTACHSGPWPEEYAASVQTSLAHKLGIGSKDRRDNSPPQIIEPIFARDEAGRIAPYRQVSAAYWAARRGEAVEPLPVEAVRKAAAKALPKPRGKETPPPLSDEQIIATLTALKTAAGDGAPAYVRDGELIELDSAGGLKKSPHRAATPYRWALAHDVRPASQALGAHGCTDCHGPTGALFFGFAAAKSARPATSAPSGGEGAAATTAATTARPITPLMHESIGYDRGLAGMWAVSLALKPIGIWVGVPLVAIIAAGAIGRFVRWTARP